MNLDIVSPSVTTTESQLSNRRRHVRYTCDYPECIIRPSFGLPSDRIRRRCVSHKTKDMINLMNGCLLCNMNFTYNKLCYSCSNSGNISLSEKFVFQYIRFYYKQLMEDHSFKVLLSVNTNPELDYNPYERLKLLESQFNMNKIVLIIISFNINQYMEDGKPIPGLVNKLNDDIKVIKDRIQFLHYTLLVQVPLETEDRVFYV